MSRANLPSVDGGGLGNIHRMRISVALILHVFLGCPDKKTPEEGNCRTLFMILCKPLGFTDFN
jgi:hypothetical protein